MSTEGSAVRTHARNDFVARPGERAVEEIKALEWKLAACTFTRAEYASIDYALERVKARVRGNTVVQGLPAGGGL